jgi:CheY-like chemotaxis protein
MDNLQKIEIILVEDSESDAKLALDAFKEVAVDKQVTHLKSGVEALEFLTNSGFRNGVQFGFKANLIIIDLHLNGLKSIEVLRAVKSNPDTKHIPVVILAVSENDPLKFTCMELGADSFITKPLTAQGFVETIESLEHYWR